MIEAKKAAAYALRKAADICEPEEKNKCRVSGIQIVTLILACISLVLVIVNLVYDVVSVRSKKCSCDDEFDEFDDFGDLEDLDELSGFEFDQTEN